MPDAEAHRILASVSRVAVLEILRQHPDGLGVQELAERMSLHPNTIRAHLKLLVEHGHVLQVGETARRPGRPRQIYTATPAGEPDPRRNFRMLAEILARHLRTAQDPVAAAIEAGRRAGEELIAGAAPSSAPTVERVVRLLDEIGFQPRLAPDRQAILLHNCPFHEIAQAQPDVVCNLHLGLLKGALQQLGASAEATRLIPMVAPGLCVLELGRRPGD